MQCKHYNLTQISEPNVVMDLSHPILCDDCGQLVECPHHEIDMANELNEPTCIDCLAHGTDVIEPMEYDKYEGGI